MAKSGWTDEDEKALLALLQKKWNSGNSGSGYAAGSSVLTPLESQGAMTDGSKRLREALDDDEFDVISSAAEPLNAQLPVMPIPIFPGIADKVLDQLTADLVPEGMSFRDWSRTKFAFGKCANEGKTYREVYVDEEMAGYCKWSMNHLGNKSTSPIAKDWYSFLCACKVVEDSGKVGKPKGCFTGTSVQRQLGD